MKSGYILKLLAVALVVAAGCEKNLLEGNRVYNLFPENGMANLKVIHAYGSKLPSLTTVGPNVHIYLDGDKITGNPVLYANSQGVYPAPSTSATNTRSLYYSVMPGAKTFRGIMARTPVKAGDTVFTRQVTLDAGKHYTAFLSDTLPNPSVTLVEDNFHPIAINTFKLRLANFAAWPNDVYDLHSRRENKIIVSGVAYKKASEFVELNVRETSDTFSIIKRSGNSPLPDTVGKVLGLRGQSLRAYTIFTRGKTTATSSSFQTFSVHLTTQY